MKGNRLWVLGTVAVIAVIVVLGWFVGVSPKLSEADAAALEQQGIDQINATQNRELAELRDQAENLDEIRAELDKLTISVPDEVEAEEFMDAVATAAAANAVAIKKITFGEAGSWGVSPAAVEGAPVPTSEPGAEAPPIPTAAEGVYTVSVSIEVIGLPGDVGRFAGALQKSPRLYLLPHFMFDLGEPLGTLDGFLFVIKDPNAPPIESDEGTDAEDEIADPEPAPTDTPAPSASPTPTPTLSP